MGTLPRPDRSRSSASLSPRVMLGVACLVVAVALVFERARDTYVNATTESPRTVAEQFLTALVAGDLGASASLMATPSEIPLESATLAALPHVAGHVVDIDEKGESAIVTARLANGNESVPLSIRLVKLDRGWRVDALRVLTSSPARSKASNGEAALRAIEGVELGTF